MKGQFFIVAAVIIVGVLLGIYQSLQNYSSMDLSEPETYSEAFVLKNIVDVSEEMGRYWQYNTGCGNTQPFEEMKYFFENKANGPFSIDYNYTLGCTSTNLLRNAYYNVTLSSNRATYFASFKAAQFDGKTVLGTCNSVSHDYQNILGTADAYKSKKIKQNCDNPKSKFLWSKDDSFMVFKVANADTNNVAVSAYTEQASGSDSDTFSIYTSSDGNVYSQCASGLTGSGSWVVSASCSCIGCMDVYVKIKADSVGSVPNIMRKIELAFP
ncbi:MAG: hypothetical protein V1836_00080 [Candidatus Aenigmatarchaeota archaeon]